jgi:hypothetical protein
MKASSATARAIALALWACVWLLSGSARAHESAPGDDGTYLVAWTAPVDTRLPSASRVTPRFPAHCRSSLEGDGIGARLDCGARGLEGEVAIDGLEGRMRVAIVVIAREGAPHEDVLEAARPRTTIERTGSAFVRWIALGAEHVLLGLDHLAFLAGLLFVSRLDRRLVLTITAFTIAHSITLALAVLDLVHPASALVEALIALSVLLVAREGLADRDAETSAWSVRRAPAAIAGFFGLVHGLGLAGALRETALPERALASALVGFNVGVELGQLAFVGAAIVIATAVLGQPWAPHARTALVYVVGCAAAYWLVVRTVAIVVRVV